MDYPSKENQVIKGSPLFIEKSGTWSQFLVPALIALTTIPLLSLFGLIFSFILLSVDFLPDDNLSLNLSAQFLGQIFGFLFILIVGPKAFHLEKLPHTKTRTPLIQVTGQIFAMGYIIYFAFNLIIIQITSLLAEPSNPYENWVPSGDPTQNIYPIVLLFLTSMVGAPLFEEYIFRRLLIPALQKRGMNNFSACIASSLVFALVHTPNNLLNGNVSYAISHFCGTLIMGFFAGCTFILTGKLLAPILFHSLFNLIGTAALVVGIFEESNPEFIIYLGLGMILILGSGVVLIIQFIIRKTRDRPSIFDEIIHSKVLKPIKKGFLSFILIFLLTVILSNLIEIVIVQFFSAGNLLLFYLLYLILFCGGLFIFGKLTMMESEVQITANPRVEIDRTQASRDFYDMM